MSTNPSTIALIAARVRGVARVWSVLVFILALILVVGTRKTASASELVNGPLDWLIPGLLVVSMIGLGIAWRWEGWGALINIGFYLAVVPLYWLLHHEWIEFSIMVGLSPVILPGVLFAVAWLLMRREKSKDNERP